MQVRGYIPCSLLMTERMLNGFWWGGGSWNKGIRWMSWDRLTCLKSKGGMGFGDLKAFTTMCMPNSLVAKRGIFQTPRFLIIILVITLVVHGVVYGSLVTFLLMVVGGELEMMVLLLEL